MIIIASRSVLYLKQKTAGYQCHDFVDKPLKRSTQKSIRKNQVHNIFQLGNLFVVFIVSCKSVNYDIY